MDRQSITSRWNISRVEASELLDLGQGTDQDVAQNLAEMQRINDVLGGTRALTRHLYPRLQMGGASPLRVIDLGSGGAGIPRRIRAWAAHRSVPLTVVAVDHAARILDVARNGVPVPLLRADALCLPLAPGSVDYVISTLFLHHFSPNALVALLHNAYRLARRGLVMSDLVRGRLPYLAFHAAAPLFARNYLTRQDGLLSIRRAYTPEELRELAERAGLRGAKVHAHFPWRMTLVVDK